MLARDLITRGARRFADSVAIQFDDRSLTYAETDQAANRIAHWLIGDGLGIGDRVALLFGNGLWSVSTDFACVKAGVIRVPLNGRLSLAEHRRMVEDTGCRLLIHDDQLAGRAAELSDIPGLRVVSIDALLAAAATEPATEPDIDLRAEDPVLWIFTSGTTGTLKAVEHTQGSWAAIAANILANVLDPQRDSVMLHAASLIHASGTFVLPYWLRGGRSAILPGFEPAQFAEALTRYQVTEINLVPTMLQMLFATGALDGVDVSGLRTIIYGASPMPRPVLARAIETFGHKLVQYYGQTEAPLSICLLDKDDHRDESLWGSCGVASVDCELRITGEDGAEVAVGEIGEIRLRAPFAMTGYAQAPELNEEMIAPGGWIRTRDMARQDERGYVYLVDRRSDMIITGGYNVYPREVEDALLSHPAVAEAAVVGAPDETWVESVTAFVVLQPDAEAAADELATHVGERLAAYKRPRRVEFVESIPKSAVGKILRRALRDPLWAEQRPPNSEHRTVSTGP